MSSIDSPLRSSSRCVASIGPVSISTGSTPTRHVSTTRAPRASARARRLLLGHHQHGCRAVGDLRELPAVCTPFSRATGFSVASFSSDVSRRPSSRSTGASSPVGLPSSSTSGASTGIELAVEATLGPGQRGTLLRREAEVVGVVAADRPTCRRSARRPRTATSSRSARSRSSGSGCRGRASCDELMPIGMRLITSTPQATATSTTPAPTSDVARLVACWLDPHCVSTVVAARRQRQPGGEPRGARDVEALLADLADAPADHLVDGGRDRCRSAR